MTSLHAPAILSLACKPHHACLENRVTSVDVSALGCCSRLVPWEESYVGAAFILLVHGRHIYEQTGTILHVALKK